MTTSKWIGTEKDVRLIDIKQFELEFVLSPFYLLVLQFQ